MAVNYTAALKTARMQSVCDLVGSKTLGAATGSFTAGQIVIGTASLSGATGVLATIPMKTTPGSVSGNVFTIDCTGGGLTANASGAGTQTAAKAELRNNAGTMICDGLTVGTSGTDVILNSTSITNGQAVTITAATLTHS
jgi:hypothetical protein